MCSSSRPRSIGHSDDERVARVWLEGLRAPGRALRRPDVTTGALMRRCALLFLAMPLLAACGTDQPTPAARDAAPLPVRVTVVSRGEVADTFESGGVVRARTSATLVSRIVAPVLDVRVRAGDRVRRGQVLITLDARDIDAHARRASDAVTAGQQGSHAATAELQAAQAALDLARATHTRMTTLRDRQSATPQEFDQSQAAVRGAEARVAAASARIQEADATVASLRAAHDAAVTTASFAQITAPFDALVSEKLVEPGNMASPGLPLLRVEDLGRVRVEVRVDESRAQFVHAGDRITVLVGDDGTRTTGTVAEWSRAVDADTRAVLVKIDLADASVATGTFARVLFPGPRRQAVTVPTDAVVRRGQLASVFVFDQGHAQLRLISSGRESGNQTEVLAGLSEGETIIVAPPPALVDGAAVARAADSAEPGATPPAPEGSRP